MFARIKPTRNLYSTLQYNEAKLKNGQAECLLSGNFVKELDRLTKKDKQARFIQRASLNERATNKILQIFISFSVTEKISNDLMREIASRYLKDMGFEKQPFLVYRHYDSGHPHCHMITTNIKSDGARIKLDKKDCWESQKIAQKLEQEFSLCPNGKIKSSEAEALKVRRAQRIEYGTSGLKRAISDVLNTVVDHYRYTSLDELNAVLRLYNVQAIRGKEDSNLYRHRGLVYRAIDKQGKWKGKCIKASDFILKPTLANLEKKYGLNEALRQAHQEKVKTAINWVLAGTPPNWKKFQQDLEQAGIAITLQADKKEAQESIFFVDHDSKCVFRGETLGPRYSLDTIRQRCAMAQSEELGLEESHRQRLSLGLS